MNFENFQAVSECHYLMMSIVECETTIDYQLCTESTHGSTCLHLSHPVHFCVHSVGSTFFGCPCAERLNFSAGIKKLNEGS